MDEWPRARGPGRALMRAMLLAIALSSAARASGVEFELAPGLLDSLTDYGTPGFGSPSKFGTIHFRARVGIELPLWTLSVVGIATPFGPGPTAHRLQDGGVAVRGLAAEVRLHNPDPLNQFALGLGAGWGQLLALQKADADTERHEGLPAPYVEGVLAYRRQFGPIRLGADFSVHAFNRIYLTGDLGTRFCLLPPNSLITDRGNIQACPEGRTFFMYLLALSVGFTP